MLPFLVKYQVNGLLKMRDEKFIIFASKMAFSTVELLSLLVNRSQSSFLFGNNQRAAVSS